MEGLRNKRYERGYKYYKRQLKNFIDLIEGDGIDSLKKLEQFIHGSSHFKHLTYIVLLIIYVYVRIFRRRKICSYDINIINSDYFFKKLKMISPDELDKIL